jgi:hypothetical protein
VQCNSGTEDHVLDALTISRPQRVLIGFGDCSPMGRKDELAFFEGRLPSTFK